ncbi:MAG: tRNA uridine-5-carboxymethylaminomethyl(34) synthesis enzyme MnmG [Candidatus Aegiribacteria sp.]
MKEDYQVIVVGGGHAGIEAALASSRIGCTTLMITARTDRVGEMSCNPAIGGIAKGTIVREVDALDGSMAAAADATSLQFRMLNRRKGPAVWGPRVQSDAAEYASYQLNSIRGSGVTLLEDEVVALDGMTGRISGVVCRKTGRISGRSVVLATGTFLRGRLYRGSERWRGGRIGDISSDHLEMDLAERGFHVERFKTGTPARVVRSTVDVSALEEEPSEETGYRFSYGGGPLSTVRERCFTTRTNEGTAEAVRKFSDRSPLLAGRIEGTGPRYCPSFEDKVFKFPDRSCHRIFVEPMGRSSRYFYLNGLSTSMPREAQEMMVRSLPGFEKAEIAIYGYAVEYSYFHHSELEDTLRLRRTENVFAAGQICGTSGYEEAAGLGVLAGINAARATEGLQPLVLSRMESYVGVMVDDIVNTGLDEPYRMFSSRAENRLHLRQDNADRRLYGTAEETGVLSKEKSRVLGRRLREAERLKVILEKGASNGVSLARLCRRGDVGPQELSAMVPELDSPDLDVLRSVMLDEKYAGYIQRNLRRHRSRSVSSGITLESIDSYMEIDEICWEAREVLEREKPENISLAERLPGVRPTDIQGLMIHLGRKRSTWNVEEEE